MFHRGPFGNIINPTLSKLPQQTNTPDNEVSTFAARATADDLADLRADIKALSTRFMKETKITS